MSIYGVITEDKKDVELTEKVNLELNPYGYYGIITKDKKFKVVTIDMTHKDKRKFNRGRLCFTLEKESILNIIERLNVRPPIDDIITIEDKYKCIQNIIRYSRYNSYELQHMSDEQFKSIYYWYVKAKKKDMCDILQRWFEENNLMIHE